MNEAMSNELSLKCAMDVNDELSDEEHQEIMFVKVLKAVCVRKKGNIKDLVRTSARRCRRSVTGLGPGE